MKPKFFATPAALRKWLEKNHATADELWVGLYKKHTGRPSVTWPEVVDQALCFGWIDGIRKSIDDESYMNRITPRRRTSNWSAINIRRVAELTKAGLMQPAGLEAFRARDPERVNRYSFERETVELDAEQARTFKANRKAWDWFSSQPQSYRKPALWWVVSARQAATRERRLATLIADSAAGLRIRQLRRQAITTP